MGIICIYINCQNQDGNYGTEYGNGYRFRISIVNNKYVFILFKAVRGIGAHELHRKFKKVPLNEVEIIDF
jgi:hypothetical protein